MLICMWLERRLREAFVEANQSTRGQSLASTVAVPDLESPQ